MKQLQSLIEKIDCIKVQGSADISGIAVDSRLVKKGDLFVAWKGLRFDGHQYIPDAVEKGASAVLSSEPLPDCAIPWVQAADIRTALWQIAQKLYDDPTKDMLLAGITGTNGKTTTAAFTRAIFQAGGKKTLQLGTIGAMLDDKYIELDHTTPEAHDLMKLFDFAKQNGAQAGVMEVSSHGIDAKRVHACRFDIAAFTNLTQDHLDYHEDMETYFQAKLKLFTEIALIGQKPFTAVVNLDDPYSERIIQSSCCTVLTYGVSTKADIRAENLKVSVSSVEFDLVSPYGNSKVRVGAGGRFNIWNSLAAIGIGIAAKIPLPVIIEGLANAKSVPGRFEAVETNKDFNIIVDYAHTPDALEKLLSTARELNPKRMVVIFGCGGNRDPLKRPKMGAIAERLCDKVIITSDNPRREDPDFIISQILEGIPKESSDKVMVEPNRKEAIKHAITTAQTGDLIVIAGKGHENYQIIEDVKYPFDDRLVAGEILEMME